MLTKIDAEELLEQLYATAEVLGSEIKPAAASLMIRDLRQYPRGEIEQSLARCRSELTGRLTLAAILERMPSADAYLSANEAWALALSGQDEMDTIVWTQEIANAMGAADRVLELGDKVGARMTFIATYEREIAKAKAEGRKPQWIVSLGLSQERRQEAIQEAVKKGLLEAPKVEHLLPAPHGFKEADKDASEEEKAKVNANIRQIREMLSDDGQAKADAEEERRRQFEARREELLRQAEDRQRGVA
ncbi:hypothetical protein AAG587_08260 [Vreelandella neptunia]|uniref:hypothetical protein n=1 Tax=Vreelandella neptunia TaxID=115551 RepID=UPI000C4789A7|nr:hypothetical protein [Halomonas sp.]MBF57712.1 hypothetical protein [Halomonas sp.]|tara:strand:+ start:16844 stop:17584 length:741 start_codon:yes stop_codon:yes gene_type:complete